jgi:Domain of unknown function (DUF4132)
MQTEVRQMVAEAWPQAQENLHNPRTDRRYIEAAADAQRSPLGAAVIERLTVAHLDWRRRDRAEAFADDWVANGGLEFAVRAVGELGGICLDTGGHYGSVFRDAFLRPLRDTDSSINWWDSPWEPLAYRVRCYLAAASDEDYSKAVVALDEYRTGSIHQRLVTSYLTPTQLDWVADDVAQIAAGSTEISHLIFGAVNSVEQLRAVLPHVRHWHIARSWGIVVTLAESLGSELLPFLDEWLDHAYTDADSTKRLLEVVAQLPTDEAFRLLLRRLTDRHAQPAAVEAADRFPVRATRLLAERCGPSTTGRVATELLRAHVRTHPTVIDAVLPDLPPELAARITGLLPDADVPVVDLATLPAVLAAPPWKAKGVRTAPVVVQDLVPLGEPAIRWMPGERAEWHRDQMPWNPWHEQNWPELAERVRIGLVRYGEDVQFFVRGPEHLVKPLLATARPSYLWDGATWAKPVIAKYELDALPLALASARAGSAETLNLLSPYFSVEIAEFMADVAARRKTARSYADAWFARHAEDAARALAPAALGKPGASRRVAETALRRLATTGHGDEVRAGAASYGQPALGGIEALLATDPVDVLPARIPSVPGWLNLAALPDVLTTDRSGVLPLAAIENLVVMLAMCKPSEPYAGVELAKQACDPASLAEFGWALFGRWAANGFPSKDGWVLDALGLIGDDETVRRLSPLIRVWPGEGGHKRAVNALDVLAAIGSDVALMHLHGISQKVKFKGLKEKAVEKVDQIADELGLTADELADRLVPDFGLDPDGTLQLDYGSRQFVVGFDEQLKPYVTEGGVRRRDLPRPGSKDDAEAAPAAYRMFAGLKKDVRTIATDQIRRLEGAMVNQRRWTSEQFQAFFVDHPLLVHLSRRLVWGCYQPDRITWFRVAEDRSLADVEDTLYELSTDASIGIAHPLHLADTVPAWTEVFADYEILQPFEQLARDVLLLADHEKAEQTISRFDGCKVKTVKILSLDHRGWRRGVPQDGGVQPWVVRPLPGGGAVTFGVDPGIIPGVPNEAPWDEQKIEGLGLGGDPDRVEQTGVIPSRWGELDPVLASEILRDLTWLTT